jgi:hypothetical protein
MSRFSPRTPRRSRETHLSCLIPWRLLAFAVDGDDLLVFTPSQGSALGHPATPSLSGGSVVPEVPVRRKSERGRGVAQQRSNPSQVFTVGNELARVEVPQVVDVMSRSSSSHEGLNCR